MLIYKTIWQKNVDGRIIKKSKWAGSQDDSATIRKYARQENGFVAKSIHTFKVNFPTKKYDIIDFLNVNAK